jgi:hypothetical protein
MNRLEDYRALALQELRSLMQSQDMLELDHVLDSAIRQAKGLPKRPATRNVYEGIFTLPQLPRNPLQNFRGDLAWIHNQEGHNGGAYWPGGESGVTLDPGIDVGHTSPQRVAELFQGILTSRQLIALKSAYKKFGTAAQKFISQPDIKSIHVTFAQSVSIMPFAAQPYWEAITNRFPTLLGPTTPASVQTVFLSLAYNRGPSNPQLAFLRLALTENDWKKLANDIGTMQHDHVLMGIRKRRRLEAQLIRDELNIK